MALKELHLSMIHEALGVMGKEICSEIVQLHQKAIAYDKLVMEEQVKKNIGAAAAKKPKKKG